MNQGISDIIQQVSRSIGVIYPEIVIASLILLLILVELVLKNTPKKIFIPLIVAAGIIIAGFCLTLQTGLIIDKKSVNFFSGFLHLDSLSLIFKKIFLLAGLLFTALSVLNTSYRNHKSQTEYYIIFLAILLGSMFMVMSTNLLMIYLSIEMVSVSSYMLTLFDFNRKSIESGIKYILFGAVSSAIMLYGISLLYGFTQNLDILSPDFISRLSNIPEFPRLVAILLLVSGFLFKMAVVPFHIWTPDIYEGAPVPLIAFFSVVPKLAGLVIFTRTFYQLNLIHGSTDWQWIFGGIAIVTMFIGNLAALNQKDAKRMMGYSSIAHSGYLMIGVLALTSWGLQSVIFHAVVFLLMNFLVFMLIEMYIPVIGGSSMKDYQGQFRNSPRYAGLLVIGFVSLIGIPPTGGFTSKFMLFSSAWNAFSTGGNQILLWLVILGVVNTLISVFYYLKIPYYMAFREEGELKASRLHRPVYLGLGIFLALLIFIVFIKPDGLVHLMNSFTFVYRGMTQ